MTRLVALVSGQGWHVQDLRRAARAMGVEFEAVPFPKVTGRIGGGPPRIEAGGIDLTGVDGVLVRMMPPGSLEQVVFRMDALHRLAAAGVPVLNPPGAVEAAVDKYLALARLDGAGLPVPETWTGESTAEAIEAFETLGGDVVVKPLFGSEGRGLVRVSDRELARRVFQALERIGAILYLQRFIRHPGHDLRAFVLGDRVLGAILRHAAPGDWRTNVAVGGRAEAVTLDAQTERLALRATRAVGARMAGVDLLLDPDRGFVVLEVNAVPGWRALASATGIDVAAAILHESAEQGRQGGAGLADAATPGQIAQVACLLEVTARKPGNVHRFADFEDTHYLDFLLSATAIAGPLDGARSRGVGAAVLGAVEATRRLVATNTNLGMVLLLAPLAAVPAGDDLRRGVAEVLAATTLEDARLVYRAIRLANPGGLGPAADQDVAAEPTATLLDAMRLAADRDLVARQYANGFAEVFEVVLPALRAALGAGRPLELAIISAHLELMARCPDTLIARKLGAELAVQSARRAADVLAMDWAGEAGHLLAEFDAWLRADGHARNPGGTADLVAAALFAALQDGTIRLPGRAGAFAWSGGRGGRSYFLNRTV